MGTFPRLHSRIRLPLLLLSLLTAFPPAGRPAFAAPPARGTAQQGAVRFLKSDQGLRTKADQGSLMAIQLRKGAEVKWLRSEGHYSFVESGSGARGYVLTLLLSAVPLADVAPPKAENLTDAQRSRIRPRTIAATMGVRGLSTDTALRRKYPPDLNALREIEACKAPKRLLDDLAAELPL